MVCSCYLVRLVILLCLWQAHIRVWNSTTLETMHVFGMGEVARAVICLAFSKAVSTGVTLIALTGEIVLFIVTLIAVTET